MDASFKLHVIIISPQWKYFYFLNFWISEHELLNSFYVAPLEVKIWRCKLLKWMNRIWGFFDFFFLVCVFGWLVFNFFF